MNIKIRKKNKGHQKVEKKKEYLNFSSPTKLKMKSPVCLIFDPFWQFYDFSSIELMLLHHKKAK